VSAATVRVHAAEASASGVLECPLGDAEGEVERSARKLTYISVIQPES
jgi:hypothetical protein